MTWCSEDSATPRFVLASSAIRCRFVDRFVRLRVLSRVSRQRFSPHDTPLPSIGSRRVRFPDVSGHIEVLRLPGTPPRSLICFASGVHATLLGSCLAARARAPGRSEGAFRAGVIVQPATRLPACSHVDVSGISQVPRRSILCLCLGPRPRPNRRSLAYLSVSSMLPPLRRQRRLRRHGYIGAIAGLQHLLPTLQEWCCHHPCKAHFRLAGSPLPGGS